MPSYGPGPISGKAFAGRIAYYISLYGTPCTIFGFQKPTVTGGAASAVAYTQSAAPVRVLIDESSAADDVAAQVGVLPGQAALGFTAAADTAKINERDILRDGTGRYWTVNALPGRQELATTTTLPGQPTTTLAGKFLLIKLAGKLPSGVS